MIELPVEYEQSLWVTISANSHDVCLDATKYIKKLCEAWCIDYSERKSARKGPVLERSIKIVQVAYPTDIITFRESLRIISKNLSYGLATAVISEISTIPKDSVPDFLRKL